MTNQTKDTIPLSTEQKDMLSKLKRNKTLKSIFYAAASAGFAVLAYQSIFNADDVFSFYDQFMSLDQNIHTKNKAVFNFLVTSYLATLALALTSTFLPGRNQKNNFNQSRLDSYKTAYEQQHKAAQTEFIDNLNQRAADNPESVTDTDLQILSLCDTEIQQQAHESISLSAALKGRLSDNYSDMINAKLKDHFDISSKKSETTWFDTALFVTATIGALVTFTIPLLLLAGERLNEFPNSDKEAELPMPQKPDLAGLVKGDYSSLPPRPSV